MKQQIASKIIGIQFSILSPEANEYCRVIDRVQIRKGKSSITRYVYTHIHIFYVYVLYIKNILIIFILLFITNKIIYIYIYIYLQFA